MEIAVLASESTLSTLWLIQYNCQRMCQGIVDCRVSLCIKCNVFLQCQVINLEIREVSKVPLDTFGGRADVGAEVILVHPVLHNYSSPDLLHHTTWRSHSWAGAYPNVNL